MLTIYNFWVVPLTEVDYRLLHDLPKEINVGDGIPRQVNVHSESTVITSIEGNRELLFPKT